MINGNSLNDHPQILNPNVRHDFTFVWSVKDGNPNGDPDNGGAPRQFDDNRIFVTDACLKRMIRDYIEEVKGHPIYISRQAKEEGLNLKDQSKDYPTAQDAIAHYWDVRMFGATYLAGGKKDKGKGKGKGKKSEETEETEVVEATEGKNSQILGPVQIGMGSSREPVEVLTTSVSRILKEDKSENTFGTKYFVPYTEIVIHGRFSGNLGRKIGVSETDMRDFWEALVNGPELRRSTMSGERKAVALEIRSFQDPYGASDSTTTSLTF